MSLRLGLLTVPLLLLFALHSFGETNSCHDRVNLEKTTLDAAQLGYVVIGATPDLETLLSSQIQVMNPEVLLLRIIFVPHWKYTYSARIFRVHTPTGMTSVMFTHLASRSVFIDNSRYLGPDGG